MKGIKEQIEESNAQYYYNLPSIEEFTKIVEELFKQAASEKPNNNRKKCSNNRS
jgi:hypothetical protein